MITNVLPPFYGSQCSYLMVNSISKQTWSIAAVYCQKLTLCCCCLWMWYQ